jgi:hypothetical protein
MLKEREVGDQPTPPDNGSKNKKILQKYMGGIGKTLVVIRAL